MTLGRIRRLFGTECFEVEEGKNTSYRWEFMMGEGWMILVLVQLVNMMMVLEQCPHDWKRS